MLESRPVILVTTRFFDVATQDLLEGKGYTVRRSGLPHDQMDTALPEGQLRELLHGVSGWIVGTVPVTHALLEGFPELRVIARRGVGYDTIDTEAAAALGKIVTIAPGGNEASVADHALAMMLGLAKRLREGHDRLADGNWDAIETSELYGKTVGLLGFGRIAQLVARRLHGFDAKILATDPAPDEAAALRLGVELVDPGRIIVESDIISLHLPLTSETRSVIGSEAIARMKPTAFIVNTSRDGLVDEVALIQALKEGRLAGAGLDVFEGESNPAARSRAETLLAFPNVVGSAHTAGSSREGLARTNAIAARAVMDVLEGKSLPAGMIVS